MSIQSNVTLIAIKNEHMPALKYLIRASKIRPERPVHWLTFVLALWTPMLAVVGIVFGYWNKVAGALNLPTWIFEIGRPLLPVLVMSLWIQYFDFYLRFGHGVFNALRLIAHFKLRRRPYRW